MADLDALIRVRRHTAQQKQKFLADLYRQAEVFAMRKKALEDQLAREREALDAVEMIEAQVSFGLYAEGVKKKIAAIEVEVKRLETRIAMAQDDVRAAFAELKKIEIIHARRLEAEKQARNKKESQTFDEIAIDQFRKDEEGG
jgi:flagellar FliJ protein